MCWPDEYPPYYDPDIPYDTINWSIKRHRIADRYGEALDGARERRHTAHVNTLRPSDYEWGPRAHAAEKRYGIPDGWSTTPAPWPPRPEEE